MLLAEARITCGCLPASCRRVRERAGFTLLEVILVMGLIVIVMSIAVPSVSNFYKGEKLMAATDGMRGAAAEARVHAIDRGCNYRLAVVPGRGNFRYAPESPEYWSGGSGEGLPCREGAVPADIGLRVVVGSQELTLAADSSAATSIPVGEVSPDLWSTVVIFRPDGSADKTVEIIFSSPHCLSLSVTLRGLTGTTSVRRLSS